MYITKLFVCFYFLISFSHVLFVFLDGYHHVTMTGRLFEIFQCQTFYQVCGIFNSILLWLLFHDCENLPGYPLFISRYSSRYIFIVHVPAESGKKKSFMSAPPLQPNFIDISWSHNICSGEKSWLSLQSRRFVAEQGSTPPPPSPYHPPTHLKPPFP